MLENGEASINKLTRIASIATPENEEELAEKIKVLPKSALDTLVRDVKEIAAGEKADVSPNPLFDDQDLPGQELKFQFADDITEELNELNSKGIDVNELLRKMLKQRREEINKAKDEIADKIETTQSRYIPMEIKKILQKEYGDKCSISICQKPAKTIHHSQRFSLSRNHNPKFLAPLCHEHHIIAHSIDIQYHRARADCFG
jgi:hypothetical protein